MANPFAKYVEETPQQTAGGNPFAKYAGEVEEPEKTPNQILAETDLNAARQKWIKEQYGKTKAQELKELVKRTYIGGNAAAGGVAGALLAGGPTLGTGAIPGGLAGATAGASFGKITGDVLFGPDVPDAEDYAKQYNLEDTTPKSVIAAQLQMLKNSLSPKHMARSVEGLLTFPAAMSKTITEKGVVEGGSELGLEGVKMLPMVYDIYKGDPTFTNERRKLAEGTIIDTAASTMMGHGAYKGIKGTPKAVSNIYDAGANALMKDPRKWNPDMTPVVEPLTKPFKKAAEVVKEESGLLKQAVKDAWTSVKSSRLTTTPAPETLMKRFRHTTDKFLGRPTGKRVRTTQDEASLAAQDIRTRNAIRETIQLENEGKLVDSNGAEIPGWKERSIFDEASAAQAAYDSIKNEVLGQTGAIGTEPISMKAVADQLRASKAGVALEDTAAHAALDKLIEDYDTQTRTPQEMENAIRHFNHQLGDNTGNLSVGQKNAAQIAAYAINAHLDNIITERLGAGTQSHRELRQRWGDLIDYRDKIAKQANNEAGKLARNVNSKWDTIAGLSGIWTLVQHSPQMMTFAMLAKANAMRLQRKFSKDVNLRKAYRIVDENFYTPREKFKGAEPKPPGEVQGELDFNAPLQQSFDFERGASGLSPGGGPATYTPSPIPDLPPKPVPIPDPAAYEPTGQGMGADRVVNHKVPLEPRGAMPEDALAAAEYANRQPVSEVRGTRPPIEQPAVAAQGEVPPPRGTVRGEALPAFEPNLQGAGEGAFDPAIELERGVTQAADYLHRPTTRGAEVTERIGAPPVSDYEPAPRSVGGPTPADRTAAASMVDQMKAKQDGVNLMDIEFLKQKLESMNFSKEEITHYANEASKKMNSGAISPKLLKAMGITSVGAAAFFALDDDKRKAFLGSIAVGSLVGAAAINQLGRHLRNNRGLVGEVTAVEKAGGGIEIVPSALPETARRFDAHINEVGDINAARTTRTGTFGEALSDAAKKFISWTERAARNNQSIIHGNSKTGLSIDFSTECPKRKTGHGACAYCYREHGVQGHELRNTGDADLKAFWMKPKGFNAKLPADEIMRMPGDLVTELNRDGGLRMFSFGDFRPGIDNTSVATVLEQAKKKGLIIKAITKEPELVKQFGDHPNLRINFSVDSLPREISRALTVEEAHQLKQGHPNMRIRSVAVNPEQAAVHAADPRIDVVTLYHGPVGEALFKIVKRQNPDLVKAVGEEALRKELDTWVDMVPDPTHRMVTPPSGGKPVRIINPVRETVQNNPNKFCCQSGKCAGDTTKCGFGVNDATIIKDVSLPITEGTEGGGTATAGKPVELLKKAGVPAAAISAYLLADEDTKAAMSGLTAAMVGFHVTSPKSAAKITKEGIIPNKGKDGATFGRMGQRLSKKGSIYAMDNAIDAIDWAINTSWNGKDFAIENMRIVKFKDGSADWVRDTHWQSKKGWNTREGSVAPEEIEGVYKISPEALRTNFGHKITEADLIKVDEAPKGKSVEQMVKAGVPAATIAAYLLADEDTKRKMLSLPVMAGMFVPAGKNMQGAFTDLLSKKVMREITDSRAKITPNIENKLSSFGYEAHHRKFGDLGEILDHPVLYKEIPELKNLRIEFTNHVHGDTPAAYHPFNTAKSAPAMIEVQMKYLTDPSMRGELKGILLHEVQHAVQQLAGFPRGEFLRGPMSKQLAEAKWGEIDRVSEASKVRKIMEETNRPFNDVAVEYIKGKADQYGQPLSIMDVLDARHETYDKLTARKQLLIDQYNRTKGGNAKEYWGSHGEEMARRTERRAGLSSAQRIGTPYYGSDLKEHGLSLKDVVVKYH